MRLLVSIQWNEPWHYTIYIHKYDHLAFGEFIDLLKFFDVLFLMSSNNRVAKSVYNN